LLINSTSIRNTHHWVPSSDPSLACFDTIDCFTLSKLVIEAVSLDVVLDANDNVIVDNDDTNIFGLTTSTYYTSFQITHAHTYHTPSIAASVDYYYPLYVYSNYHVITLVLLKRDTNDSKDNVIELVI